MRRSNRPALVVLLFGVVLIGMVLWPSCSKKLDDWDQTRKAG